jgi:hypothetical protein
MLKLFVDVAVDLRLSAFIVSEWCPFSIRKKIMFALLSER